MKHLLIASGIIACLLLSSGQGFAQIDNLTNMSAEWVRMSNRNAATDAADIVVYNPAGLVSLSDGFHLNVSNQMLFRKPSHSFNDPLSGRLSFEQDRPDLFVPNLYASYKKGLWSIFGGVYMPGSAGAIDYPDGSITTRELGLGLLNNPDPLNPFGNGNYTNITNEHLKGTSLYLATSLGGAYKLTDKVSVAAGIRNISVSNTIKGGLTMSGGTGGEATPDYPLRVNVNQQDNGWGGVLGIQVRPDDKLNLALHYESRVKLDLKTDIKGGDNISETAGLYADGEKNRRDFPGMVGMGASYQFTPEFRGELDANYWFQKAANWGKASDGRDISRHAGDCWGIGITGVYQVSPELDVSAGTLYTLFRWDDIDAYYNANPGSFEVQYSDNVNLGAGFGYKVLPGLKLNCGLNYTWWKDESIVTPIGKVDMKNSTFIFAVGFDYSI
jgi:long-chain fatty acid transport protein